MAYVPFVVQRPPAGPFNKHDLQWESRQVTQGKHKGKLLQEAHIPVDRVDDFINGTQLCFYSSRYATFHSTALLTSRVSKQGSAVEARPLITVQNRR